MKCTQVFTTFPQYLKCFWQAQAASDWTGRIVRSYFQISPKTFGRVQVWALAGLLKDIRRVVQTPLLSCLGFLLKFFGLLEDEPLLQSEDHSALEQVNINDDFVHCCIYLSLDLDKSPSSHNIMLLPPCFIVGIVPCSIILKKTCGCNCCQRSFNKVWSKGYKFLCICYP